MGMNYKKYQHLADNFNKKYGVNFSYKDFEVEVWRNKSLSDDYAAAKRGYSQENIKYVSEFESLFDMAFTNALNKRIAAFTPQQIAEDYKIMMEGYRAACKDSGDPFTQDWAPNSLLMKGIENEMKDVTDNKQDYMEDEYLRGAYRIRDMRRDAKAVQEDKEISPEKLSAILNYANTLKKVNDDRPGWWRFVHFIRNAAEQREAKNMRDMVNEKAKAYDKVHGEGSCMQEIEKHLNDSAIQDYKNSINEARIEYKKEEDLTKLEKELSARGKVEEKEILLDDEETLEKIRENIGDTLEAWFEKEMEKVGKEDMHEEKELSQGGKPIEK